MRDTYMSSGLFSSRTDEWATPQALYDELNREFNFTLDPCATSANAKCERYFTKEQDGLKQSWIGEVVFCNPPYGKEMSKWVEKAHRESSGATVVMLIPARTDTRYFHEFIYQIHEVRFIKGRLRYNDGRGQSPFPSMIVVMRPSDTKDKGEKL